MQRIAKLRVMEAFLFFIFNFEEDFWFSILKMEEAFFFMSPLDHLYLWMVLPLLTGPLKNSKNFSKNIAVCVKLLSRHLSLWSPPNWQALIWTGMADVLTQQTFDIAY